MNIVLVSDDNYFKYLCVTVESIYRNNINANLVFYILTNANFNPINKCNFDLLSKKYKKAKFYLIDTNKYYPSDFYKKIRLISSHVAINAYDRICIPNILQNEDRALYLDIDLVVNGDISEFYNTSLNNNLASVVRDSLLAYDIPDEKIDYFVNEEKLSGVASISTYKILKDKLHLSSYRNYFNSGVMLLELNNLRKFDFFNKCVEYLLDTRNFYRFDQDMLNAVLNGRLCFADAKFNTKPVFYQKIYSNKSLPVICHYWGKVKPWNAINQEEIGGQIWWKYSMKSIYSDLIRKEYGVNIPLIKRIFSKIIH